MTRVAGVMSLFLGLGFGIPGVVGARHLAVHHEVWRFLGFPTYGEGPFLRVGIATTVPLLLGFVAVCVAELVVGVGLWSGWHPALWLSLVLVPVELVFWTGFALPFAFVIGGIRVVLTVLALLQPAA